MKFSNLNIQRWQILTLALVLFLSIQLTHSPADCVSEEQPVTVRGNSLSGIVEAGDTLKILVGYYQCHPVERGEIVAYKYAGNDVPIIKIVKGIEGDKFKLKKSKAGCWNILINAKILKNSSGRPYCLDERGWRMLSLYEQDYKGVIPKNAYLILGNLVEGSLDSSRFGLVDKSDFLGKVVK
jgi:signal peptidase I